MRNQTPQERERQRGEHEARWQRQTQERIDRVRAQVAQAAARGDLTPEERRLVESLDRKARRSDPFTGCTGGELLSLTERQVGWLNDITSRRETPRPVPGSRAARYGRHRG